MPFNLGQQARAAFTAPVLEVLSPVLGPTPGLLSEAFDLAVPTLMAALSGACDARLVSQQLLQLLQEPTLQLDEAERMGTIRPGDQVGRIQQATMQGQRLIEQVLGDHGVALARSLSQASDITPVPALRVLSLSGLVLLSLFKKSLLQQGNDVDALEKLVAEQAQLLREQPGAARALAEAPPLGRASGIFAMRPWVLWALAAGILISALAVIVQGRIGSMSGQPDATVPAGMATLNAAPGMVRVYFRETQWEPPDDTARLLANVVAYARQYDTSLVVLQGYEVQAPDSVQTRLSRSRLMAVRGVLISAGIVEDRIRMANPRPIAEQGDAEAGRRVDVSIQR